MDRKIPLLHKKIHNLDIKPILTDDTVPTGDPWDTKEPEIRRDFVWGTGLSAIEIITKGEFNTDPDTIKTDKLIQLFREYYMPKRNTYHSCGDFFWVKQEENETPEEHWKKLITLEKNCDFKDIKQEDLLISKFITSITDKKLQEKLIREKTLNLKTTVELITQNNYDRRHKQSTMPTALAKDEEIKEEPNQKIQPKYKTDKYGNTAQKKNNCGFRGHQNWNPQHVCQKFRQKMRNATIAKNGPICTSMPQQTEQKRPEKNQLRGRREFRGRRKRTRRSPPKNTNKQDTARQQRPLRCRNDNKREKATRRERLKSALYLRLKKRKTFFLEKT